MTAKFLKTYLWAFVAFTFLYVLGAVVATDFFPDDAEISQYTTVLIVFSLPALICLLAFVVAKIVNFKSAKLFRFNFPAIAIDCAIVLFFLIMALVYVKLKEGVALNVLIDFGNPKFLLILGFAVLVAVLVILLKVSLTNFKERIPELNWDKLGGKFFLIFYLATLLFSVLSIVVAFLIYKQAYHYYSDFCIAVVLAVLCFTAVIALAALLSAAADFLNKHTKSISILLLIVFLAVIVFGSMLYVVLCVKDSSYSYGFSVSDYEKSEYVEAPDYAEAIDDSDFIYEDDNPIDYQDYDRNEDEDPLDANNKLAFLWDNTDDDDENVKTAIRYGLKHFSDADDEEHTYNSNYFSWLSTCGYSPRSYTDGGLTYYRIMQYICKYRTRIPLRALAEAYWSQIENNVSNKMFKKKKIDVVVNMLRWTYNNIDNQNAFGNINRIMTRHNLWEVRAYYPYIVKYVDVENLPYPLKEDDGEINENMVVWAYSFWGRRYAEGNAEDVYEILNDLWKSYK